MGRNLSVVELVWETTARGLRLAELAPVEFERLTVGRDGELRILTREESIDDCPEPVLRESVKPKQ